MKARLRQRQRFVLTPEEKKIVACVLAAVLLGLITKHYRAAHPRPPAPRTAQEERAAKAAERVAAAKARAARTAERAAPPTATAGEVDDDE